ncbi:pentatricopeptide repeat-containing protein At1g08070, chloroplastic-like isoform X1 [Nymphaea colorata]|nr:pentatricopeptide repeat-containing protein At1g08070, chloroplastic-like isoform X1 [Nymphaea colorata]
MARLLEDKLSSFLQACGDFRQVFQIHAQMIINYLSQSHYLLPKIVAQCGTYSRMSYAHQVFSQTHRPNVVLWNTMFKGYAENEFYRETVELYARMHRQGIPPNNFTFPFVLKSCAKLSAFREGTEVHSIALKMGLIANVFVATTLVDVYVSCRATTSARRVFDEMSVRNVISWTAIIAGYISVGDLALARNLFNQAPEHDMVLWNTMLVGYRDSGDMVKARMLFEEMPVRDVISWNSLLIGYANDEDLSSCLKVFEAMPERNLFSWNGMLGAYANSNRFQDVLNLFRQMLESKLQPNDASLVIVLSACARLGALDTGKWVHSYANNNGFKNNLYVDNGLVDMYAKCGSLETAICIFDEMPKRDAISWNAMIGGLAMHGQGIEALGFFEKMLKSREIPDHVTFVGVLSACAHSGLVDEGLQYFCLMSNEYGIQPMIEHCGCMVDLLGRAGLLVEAADFISRMAMEADSIIWSSLLGACRLYGNIRLAEYCIEKLIELEPSNAANYVLMSNIYGAADKWENFAEVKLTMKEKRIRKKPGRSSIEVNNSVRDFYSSDDRHLMAEVYDILKGLTEVLKSAGYEPSIDSLTSPQGEES